jgi:hypothetical protein
LGTKPFFFKSLALLQIMGEPTLITMTAFLIFRDSSANYLATISHHRIIVIVIVMAIVLFISILLIRGTTS